MTRDVKGDLFGRVNTRRTGKHVPDPKRLHAPFEVPSPWDSNATSIAYRFCQGCGLVAEVNEAIARRLADEAGTPFDGPVPSGIYFETEGCAYCAGGETIGLAIKPLPELPAGSAEAG
jgi:hypothetical protein